MIGIYKITFADGQFYIGQSSNIEKRLRYHDNLKGKGSPKLINAYTHSTVISKDILEECTLENLSSKERYYIETLRPTLNTLPGGEGMCGLNHPKSKYTKEQIEQVVRLFTDTLDSYAEIVAKTGVATSSVHDICKGRTHIWATVDKDLETPHKEREQLKCKRVYDSNGIEYIIETSVVDFEREHNIPSGTINRVLSNVSGKTQSGWYLTPPDLTKYTLVSDEGIEFSVTVDEMAGIFREFKLPAYARERIRSGYTYKGWLIKDYQKQFMEALLKKHL